MVPNDTRVILYRSMWFDPLPVIVSVLISLCVIFTLYIFWIINTFILINEDIYKCLSFAILYSQNKIIATEIHGASCVFYVTRVLYVTRVFYVTRASVLCNTDSVPYDVCFCMTLSVLYDTCVLFCVACVL